MARMHAEGLISGFGKAINMEGGLKLDEKNHLILKMDDGPDLHFEYFEEEDILVLASALPSPSGDKKAAVYELLLSANFMWQGTGGATLSINPETKDVIVHHKLDVKRVQEAEMEELVTGFAKLCEYWQQRMDAPDLPSDDGGPGPQSGGPDDFSSMIRV
ncbi:MAG: type III secretion system chaperone [Pseudomonadota bacterium]